MRILTSISNRKLNDVPGTVEMLEANGFTDVSTQENKADAFLPLGIAALNSSQLGLRTSISIAFARSPMSSAMLAWDIQAASAGRFTLGLGSQVKGHNVRRFSVPWSAPAPRMREYVQSIKAIWDCWANGSPLNFQGDHYQFSLMTPNFTPDPLEVRLPKIEIAAVGPAMMNVAAAHCDGVMLHSFCTRDYLEQKILPRLDRGLTAAGKHRAGFEISGGGFVATGADDASVQQMFEWVRSRIGFYGSTPSYWPVFEVHGIEDLGHKFNEMSKRGEWDEMTRAVSDDVVHLFAAVGRYDELRDAITARFGGMTDVVALPEDTPPEVVQEVRSIETPLAADQP